MAAAGGEQETVEGTVTSVVFRNDETGFTILHVDTGRETATGFRHAGSEITVLGTCAAAWEGEDLHATGAWVDDPVRGRQFKAKSIACIPPKSAEGIRRYLASGLIRGIGPVLANRIVDHFGAQTIDVLDHHSGRLREIEKVGPKKIASIVQGWREGKGTREVMIFTQTYGISPGKAAKIYRMYGPDSVAIIKKDPYRLCRDIWGIGFATADNIALAVGLAKDSPLRARAAIVHTLRTEADEAGHCWTSEPDLLLHAQEMVGISVEILAEALKNELDAGRVVKEDDRLYLRDLWVAERRVALKLRALLAAPASFAPIEPDRALAWWEGKTGFTLAPAQARAVRASVGAKVSIVTGGPGVGKTTIVRALVEIFSARGGAHRIRVALGAPTGRAAKRMSEATGAPAQTLHRLLKYNPQTNEFTYNEENPLPGDVFIFDETSMVDIRLMADLVAALPSRATLILVGDIDQLPSVGPGNVLRDLIASRAIPTTQLTEIFRQDSSGLIVRNAHHVNAGEPFETRAGESDFYFIAQPDPEKALAYALDFMVTRIPRHFGLEPMQDVQVLTPMRRLALGSENLNVAIQRRLNGEGPCIPRGALCFRAGDRVMQLRNNYDKDVFNGDIGFVQEVNTSDRSLVALFDGRPVEYRAADLEELTLAYATTIHKSQGSEYPAVIVLLHRQHFVMLQRNLLYTAITRGRKLVLVIGDPWAVKKAIETNVVCERRTSLAARLEGRVG